MSAEYKEEILDSPLVVHKETDASYQEAASEVSMNSTHLDEDGEDFPTLQRHRFKRKKRSRKPFVFIIALLAVAAGVLCALYYSGNIGAVGKPENSTTKKSYTTRAENKFEGIITVKGSYIFFEGKEIDGINALERKIKYLEKGTKFIIQDENADFNLLTLDSANKPGGSILSLLSKYEIDYDVKHIVSSGLISKYETTAPAKTTDKSSKKKKGTTKPKADTKKASSAKDNKAQ